MSDANLKFGMFEEFTLPFETGSISSVFSINSRECICATSRNLHKFEKGEIKMSTNLMKFSACLMIPDTDLIVGITARTNLLYVFKIVDISHPIIDGYFTNHHGVFHLFYSPASMSLILVGYGIKVFYLRYKYSGSKLSIIPPEVTISLRSRFCNDYDTTILTPPSFDPDHETLYLPTPSGICPFDLDGNCLTPASRYPASIATVYCYNHFSRSIFTFDAHHGLIKWTQSGQIEQHFQTTGNSVFAILLVDEEHIVCLNASKQLFLLNFITGRTFYCMNLDKLPSRLFMLKIREQPYLAACFGATLRGIRIDIPWKVWYSPIRDCIKISRCNRLYEAGRILVQTKNYFLKIFSPSTSRLITVATHRDAVTPVSFLYDRGFIQIARRNGMKFEFVNISTLSENFHKREIENDTENINDSVFLFKTEYDHRNQHNNQTSIHSFRNTENNNSSQADYAFQEKESINEFRIEENELDSNLLKRDILFFVLENGIVLGFNSSVNPCEEIFSLDLKAHFLLIIHYNGRWCYAAISENSYLSIYDYHTFALIERLKVSYHKVINAFYNAEFQSIVFVFEETTILFSLLTKEIVDEVEINGCSNVEHFGDLVRFGYESGHITTLYIEDGRFSPNITDYRPHYEPITSFSFSTDFWLSSSVDSKILVWNYFDENVVVIKLPLPIFSCCLMNGKRDILLSTETEIMKISGYSVFYEQDDEDEEIDNFDKLSDFLDPNSFTQFFTQKNNFVQPNKGNPTNNENKFDNQNSNEIKNENVSILSMRKYSRGIENNSKKSNLNNKNIQIENTTRLSNKETINRKLQIDDNKKLEEMMKMNGIITAKVYKIPTVSYQNNSPNTNSSINIEQNATKLPKNSINKKTQASKNSIKKTELKNSSMVKASNFIHRAIEEEEIKLTSKKKKVKRKKVLQKYDNESKVNNKSAVDLLDEMFNRTKNKSQVYHTNDNQKKEDEKSNIDFAALVKQFNKEPSIAEENKGQTDSDQETSSISSSSDIIVGKERESITKTHSSKPKAQKPNEETKIHSMIKEHNNKKDHQKQKKAKNIKKKEKKVVKLQKVKKQIEMTYPTTNISQEIDIKSDEDSVNPQQKYSVEKKYMKNTATQGSVLGNRETPPLGEGILPPEENKVYSLDENNSDLLEEEIIKDYSDYNISENDNDELIKPVNDELIERNFDKDLNEKQISSSEIDLNHSQNDSCFDFDQPNGKNLNHITSKTKIQKQNPTKEFKISTGLKTPMNKNKSIENKSPFSEKSFSYNPNQFTPKIVKKKSIQNIQSFQKNKNYTFKQKGQFQFKLTHTGNIEDIRKRPATPEPINYNNVSVKERKSIHVRYLHRSKSQNYFDFDINNIPPNIIIDENAIYAKYFIRPSDSGFRSKSRKLHNPIELDDKIPNNFCSVNLNQNLKVHSPKLSPKRHFFRRTVKPETTNGQKLNQKNDQDFSENSPHKNNWNNNHKNNGNVMGSSNNTLKSDDFDGFESVEQTINRLTENQNQIHKFQKEFKASCKHYNSIEEIRYERDNESENQVVIKMKENNFPQMKKLEYSPPFTIQLNKKNEIRKEKKKTPEKIIDKKVTPTSNEFKFETSVVNANFELNDDVSENDFHTNKVIEPNFQIQNCSPRAKSKGNNSQNTKKIFKKDTSNANSNQNSGRRYFNSKCERIRIKREEDKLEAAFLSKLPTFEMKKRPNSARKMPKKPKIYSAPVWPPVDRCKGIDGTILCGNNLNFVCY
ncbi:hypothetical protein TRFO_20243 [Tritrichomonas foetus]|uniref:Uncharacterized protein n=1 Tax=Tritrichomonas foetus TaxID=1144522 RepID=A0A1J4KHD6_9EUKA|nr:hypothetical protein TRFO_20243 [Tritrichomonas foetus]|eukprot:OHT10442.1 hypothetical protein TRFO_20243 [Tritrichomonas foetus]